MPTAVLPFEGVGWAMAGELTSASVAKQDKRKGFDDRRMA
jgi:hypothetical protein